MKKSSGHDRFALWLLMIFAIIWTTLAIHPSFRSDWLLENVIVFLAVPALIQIHRHMPLSKLSYSLIFIFSCLHQVGAHYTYALVPYDSWFQALTGAGLNERLGWERNHYDRVIHFTYGLLILYPVREMVIRVSKAQGFWAYLLPLLVVISSSTIFELFEWGAAVSFGGDLGVAYLGTQGDVWDAQKDMLFAAVGAISTTLIVAGVNFMLDRNFTREWVESLRVKRREPLGEVALAKMLAEKKKSK
jgi:putative membrane protein